MAGEVFGGLTPPIAGAADVRSLVAEFCHQRGGAVGEGEHLIRRHHGQLIGRMLQGVLVAGPAIRLAGIRVDAIGNEVLAQS